MRWMMTYLNMTPIESKSKEENPISRMSRLMKGKVYRPLPDWKHHIELGFIFGGVDEFRKVLVDYCMQDGFNIVRLIRNLE